MAAFTGTPVSAPDYVDQVTNPFTKVLAAGVLQVRKFSRWTHTATEGSGTGVIYLGVLPAGEYVISPPHSVVVTSAFAANADLHVGTNAYMQISGTAATADDNNIFDNVDAATGGVFVGTLTPFSVSAAEPVRIEAMIDTGNIEADDTIDLYLAFIKLR